MPEQKLGGADRSGGGRAAGPRQAQGGALPAQELGGHGIEVSSAEIDRLIATYRKNADPEVAARMDRKMAEEIIRDGKITMRENARENAMECSRESIRELIIECADYNWRVAIPKALVHAYCLKPV